MTEWGKQEKLHDHKLHMHRLNQEITALRKVYYIISRAVHVSLLSWSQHSMMILSWLWELGWRQKMGETASFRQLVNNLIAPLSKPMQKASIPSAGSIISCLSPSSFVYLVKQSIQIKVRKQVGTSHCKSRTNTHN